MYLRLAKRVLFETNKRLLWKFVWNFGVGGTRSVMAYKKRMKKGEFFPPFLYVSVINSCNLRCQGCWVDVSAKQQILDVDDMNRLISEAKDEGNRFFGIVGGEPFMHPRLIDIFEAHPDCYFQVFTNGHFITPERAERLRKTGNVTPLISVEGTEIVSDERRGRAGVLSKTMQGIQNCLDANLLTGVCTSVCKTNIDDIVRDEWVDKLIEMGVMYTWFHIYRPMGPEPNPDLCLSQEEQSRVREFVVNTRVKKPIAVIDAYFDHAGEALCPAATGISHHINPWGGIEPCPIIQFTKENVLSEGKTLGEKIKGSPFLADFRQLAAETTKGCIVLERPDLLADLVEKHAAEDGTVRGTAMNELRAMAPRTSQYHPEVAIPEKSWAYRLAKWLFFQSFGIYDGKDHSQTSAAYIPSAKAAGTAPLVQLEVPSNETAV